MDNWKLIIYDFDWLNWLDKNDQLYPLVWAVKDGINKKNIIFRGCLHYVIEIQIFMASVKCVCNLKYF